MFKKKMKKKDGDGDMDASPMGEADNHPMDMMNQAGDQIPSKPRKKTKKSAAAAFLKMRKK